MAPKNVLYGHAFEYACILALLDEISPLRQVEMVCNSSLDFCKSQWENLDEGTRNIYSISARVAAKQILQLEPRIADNTKEDTIQIMLQPDSAGIKGDVRDVLIIRSNINWEIGLSLKHNNFAVKHSRIASNLDFGKVWFDHPCSSAYWEEVTHVFDFLKQAKEKDLKFSEIKDKENKIYIPLLEGFMSELRRMFENDASLPGKLVEYLLGRHDFYKVIGVENKQYTSIQGFNIHGELNLPTTTNKSKYYIPKIKLPKRLIHLDFVPGSKTTLELYLDEGWQFTFRIHNASTKAEPSLKFDIQIKGMPTAIITFNCNWI